MQSFRKFLDDYEWFHTWIGVAGNVAFVVGSLLFLSESTKHIGTWLFIGGSTAMLVGSVGSAVITLHRHHQDDHPERARQTVAPSDRQLSLDYAGLADAERLGRV